MASSPLMLLPRIMCLSLALWACQGEPGATLQAGPEEVAEFYSDDTVWRIDIRLDEASLQRLRDFPRFYVDGEIRIGDEVISHVGVRLKGQYSFQGLGGKPSFKIKFNSYVDDQRFLGLEKLTFNNMRQDRSQVHEWLAYRIFRAAGVPAPRSSYARITVNGELYGLYANIETMDDRFLEDRFGSQGNLYEATWGADLDPEAMELFEQDEGEDISRDDLQDLVLEVSEPNDEVFFARDALIDTEEFLRFMAAEAVVGHWDGYWKSNNYFLYHDLDRDKWSFHPWGLDQSFDQDLHPFASAGALARKCIALPSCKAEYARIGAEVVAAVEAEPLAEALDRQVLLLAEYLDEDPRTPHPPDKAHRFQDIVHAWVDATPDRLAEHFSCMEDGLEQDRDGDGFLACQSDCNDYDDASHPGAPEICDGQDNDCDGQIDEVDCECEEVEMDGNPLFFCEQSVDWVTARDACRARGLELATLDHSRRSAEAFARAAELAPNRSWFIAANDRQDEGSWHFPDESSAKFLDFAPGEPDDFGDEDCAVLASFADGEWADVRCDRDLYYICEALP